MMFTTYCLVFPSQCQILKQKSSCELNVITLKLFRAKFNHKEISEFFSVKHLLVNDAIRFIQLVLIFTIALLVRP